MRYYNPGQTQYTEQFVPMPLDFMQGRMEKKQAGFDAAQEFLQESKDEFNINAIPTPEHQAKKNEVLEPFRIASDELTNKLLTTGNYQKVLSELKNLNRQFLNHPEKKALEFDRAWWDKDATARSKLTASGDYAEYRDNGGKWTRKYSGSGEYSRYEGDLAPQEDWTGAVNTIMDTIKASSSYNKNYGPDIEGNVVGHATGWEKISRDDIQRVAEAGWRGFQGTKEFDAFLDYCDWYGLDEAEEYMRVAMGRGEKQVHRKTKEIDFYSHAPAHVAKKLEEKRNKGYEMPEGKNEKTKFPIDYGKLNERGIPIYGQVRRADRYGEHQYRTEVIGYESSYSNLDEKEQKIFTDVLLTKYPSPQITDKFMKSDEAINYVKDYFKGVEDRYVQTGYKTSDYIRMGQKGGYTRKQATDDIKAYYASRVWYNPQTGEKHTGSSDEFYKKILANNPDNIKTVLGEWDNENNFASNTGTKELESPIAVQVYNEDTKVHETWAVTRDAYYQNSLDAKIAHDINNVYSTTTQLPLIEHEIPISGNNYLITYSKNLDKNKWTYKIKLKSDNTNFIYETDDLEFAISKLYGIQSE